MRTSKKSKSSSKASSRRVDRPYDPAVLEAASRTIRGYRLVLEPDDHLGYIDSALEMPTVFADGRTPDACVKATHEALTVAAATMIEMDQRPTSARSRRNLQINVRLTTVEKLALEEAAAVKGFRGISDFVRNAALDSAGAA